ncbi:hypothetical protein RJ639_001655 [Escallonia herrerae]|uniref:Amino acid transporter transmembrane domain-containing protein n=1 Tax=Escallonia herrerae TaxID=1293975 RepID=A0AA88XBP1_9ASTE|nr:hypothetical protein RJ639_001655 [Escallonia herrerae]
MHSGYHLTTSIVAPPLLSLPFAFASLGWAAGVLCLFIGALVTFYSYNLISLVLEHHAQLGHRHLRFRDMANDIIGPRWGRYYVGITSAQFGPILLGAVVGSTLLGGQCMKAIYLLSNPDGTMKLYEFVIIFGCLILNSIFSLTEAYQHGFISTMSRLQCLRYCWFNLYSSSKGPKKGYSLSSNNENRIFGIFNAVAIIATTFGNGIIPEIQATLAPPVKGKMFKGLCVCYAVVICCISGYWAFGNQAEGLILGNFSDVDERPLVPKWFILMTNIFIILQLSAVAVVYLQPTNEVLERTFSDPMSGEFSARNTVPRMISRSLSVILAATIAAMLPFFGDINAVIGAFGFMPLDFVLPVIFYNLTFKPSKQSLIFWLNATIAVVFSTMAVIAAVAAVRQISLDAKTYRLFANI